MAVFYSGSRPEGAKELNASTPAQAPTEASVRLVSSAGAELFNERLPAIGGSFEYGREYTLVEGMMSIEFPCGAEAILEAPSIIQIADPMRLVVKIGECSVHAPDGAEGFRVDTPQNSIRDLGTRFSVSVGDNGTAEVQVIEGAAEVSSLELDRATLASELMTEHEAVRIGGKSMDRLEFDPEEYRYSLPDRVIGYDVEGTSTDGSQDTILQSISVQRGGRVIRYEAEQLIQPKLTHFRGIGGVPHLCFTSESEGRPSIDFHESDHALTTGWINPGGSVKGLTSSPVLGDSNQLGTPGFAVQFDGGVRNGPGPDVVLFELQSLIELPSGDVFHVSPLVFNDNLRTHTVRRFDVTTKTPGVTTVAPIWVAKRGTLPPNKSELAMISGECFQPTRSFVALVVGIDLSDLGYTEGELVESLFFQDAQDDSFGFDPTLIGGLPALDR